MTFTTQKTYLFLLLLCFLSANISESAFLSFSPTTFTESITNKIPALKPTMKLSSALFDTFKKVWKIKEGYDNIQSIHDFLEKYGYINNNDNDEETSEKVQSAVKYNYINNTEVETVKQLEYAIAIFQQNYDINVTGYLDELTYEILSKPRCGVPDIVNGTITITKADEKISFKPWWRNGDKNLTYAFHPNNNVGEIVKSLFKDAFNRWSNVTKLNFTETTLTNSSDIFVKGSCDILIVFMKLDGKGGAVGGTLIRNDIDIGIIYFDVEEHWVLPSVDVDDNHMDFESNVMHQIGHLLGLGHSSKEEAVMYPIVLPKRKIELVNADDLQRIQQIYDDKSIDKSSANHQHSRSFNIVLGLTGGFVVTILLHVCMFF